jgi:hypothetical protein
MLHALCLPTTLSRAILYYFEFWYRNGSSVSVWFMGETAQRVPFSLLRICLNGKYFSGYHQADVPHREQLQVLGADAERLSRQ